MSERPFTLSCCDTEIVWKDAENNVRQWMYRLRFSSREMQQGPIGLFYDEDGVLVIESPDNLIWVGGRTLLHIATTDPDANHMSLGAPRYINGFGEVVP